MKNNLKKISAVLLAGALVSSQSFADTKSLEDRVSELEANQSLNIFNFSGTFITRFDDITNASQNTPNNAGSPAFSSKNLDYMRLKFQLNADANVSKYIKFYSRFTTSKIFNSETVQGTAGSTTTGDLGAANAYQNSNVVLEKAYVDISIPDTALTVSIGRLPTVDGQPANYLDGRARLGTYPLLAYNSYFDGIGLTYRLDQFMPADQKLALRLLYTPLSQTNMGIQGNEAYMSSPVSEAGGNISTEVPVYAAQADYSIDNTKIANNIGVVFQYIQTGKLYIPGAQVEVGQPSSLMINFQQMTLASEFNGIAGSPFDLSASYLYSITGTHGNFGGLGGFGNADGSSQNQTGGNLLLSARFRLPTWIFGAEYVNGSKNSEYTSTAEQDLTNFYGTQGNAYHIYVTKKFSENVALRIGFTEQKYNTTPLSIGATGTSDRSIQTAYVNLRTDF